jgi:hypothetical protein
MAAKVGILSAGRSLQASYFYQSIRFIFLGFQNCLNSHFKQFFGEGVQRRWVAGEYGPFMFRCKDSNIAHGHASFSQKLDGQKPKLQL